MSSAAAQPLSPADLEARLAALGVPVARLIAASRIARSTWRDWRAGRTRPRPDRWTAATAAFDALVAEATPAPGNVQPEAVGAEPVTLTGSSAPTGAPPNFVPIATAAPAEAVDTPAAEASCENIEALIAAHPAALAIEAAAAAAAKTAVGRYAEATPRRPADLFWRVDDPFHNPRGRERSPSGGWYQFYTDTDVAELREQPEPRHFASGSISSPEGPGMAWRPNPHRIARKAAILTAYDEWQAACSVIAERVGVKVARAERSATWTTARHLEEAILETPARTLAEIAVKARWIEAQGKVEEWADYVLYDVLNLAEETEQIVLGLAAAAEGSFLQAAA